MQNSLSKETEQVARADNTSFGGPIWTLILLAPFIAEVLSGSTRLSYIFVLVPEVMVWGVGALLCRELVRRWRGGATSLLLLGLALSIAEEFVIQQTSLAPLPFPGSNASYGRIWGVNWVYFFFMLGFESVWVVLVPVQLTELLFASRRERPWLRTRGIFVSCTVFVVGSFMAWYGWTQQALPRMHVAPYHPPFVTVALGIVAIVLLGLAAHGLRGVGRKTAEPTRRTAPAWLAVPITAIMGGLWWGLLTAIFVPRPPVEAWEAVIAGLLWSLAAYGILRRWSSSAGWSNRHRWAVVLGATLAAIAVPYFSLAGWLRIDLIAKIVFDACATAGLLVLGRRIAARSTVETG